MFVADNDAELNSRMAWGQNGQQSSLAMGMGINATTSFVRNNIQQGIVAGSAFQNEAADIRKAINQKKQLGQLNQGIFQEGSASVSANNLMYQSSGQGKILQRSISPCVHHHSQSQEQFEVVSGVTKTQFPISKNIERSFKGDSSAMIVVEKNQMTIKKAQQENELKTLRKANQNLENKLQAVHDVTNNYMSGNGGAADIQFDIPNLRSAAASASIAEQSQKLSFKKEYPNPYDNKKKLTAMTNNIIQNVRKEALQRQQDGSEVADMKIKRDEAEESKTKTQAELEKENMKLRNKAIRAQFEIESFENKLKEAEAQKYSQLQETKNKQSELKLKQTELTNCGTRKAKIETEIISTKLILKDKEGEILRQHEKLKLNAAERIKTLHELELNIQRRNLANQDFEKVRADRDRIVEETEKRQVEADNRYEELQHKQLKYATELQTLEKEITVLESVIAEERQEQQQLDIQHRTLADKNEEKEALERKLRKKDKQVQSLQTELDLVRREKKIEIVEKIVEKPIVIEKPVVVEKEVIVREEIKADEPLQRELEILREETVLMSNNLKTKTSEVEVWKRKFEEMDNKLKQTAGELQMGFASEKQGLQIHYEKGVEEVQTLQGKLNLMLAEIHQLSNINISKNREMQQQLNVLARDNRQLENVFVSSTPPPIYHYHQQL